MNCLPFEVCENIWSQLCIEDLCSTALVNSRSRFISYQVLYKHPRISSREQLRLFCQISPYAQTFVRVLDLKAVHQHVTDKLFQGTFQHLACLHQVNLDQCVQLSSSTIHYLVEKNIVSIHSLSLSDCKISKNTLALVGKACQYRLTSLDLSNTMIQPCSSIDSSHHLEDMIGLSSPNLRHLDLSYCTWVNNLTIKNIAHGLPKLQHIILQWCSQVKADAITEMVQQLIHLNTIDIRNIESVGSSEQVEDLINGASSLKKVLFTYKRSAIVQYPSYT